MLVISYDPNDWANEPADLTSTLNPVGPAATLGGLKNLLRSWRRYEWANTDHRRVQTDPAGSSAVVLLWLHTLGPHPQESTQRTALTRGCVARSEGLEPPTF